jgi:hypothetical protein
MYDNQRPLRQAAKNVLEQDGFAVEVLHGSGGARLRATKNGVSKLVLVRTSSDGWLGWMRGEAGAWRGLNEAGLVLAAAVDQSDPTKADVYAFEPRAVANAFDQNLASREARMPNLKKTAPIFVSLDPVGRRSASAGGANLKAQAIWSRKVDLEKGTLLLHEPAAKVEPASILPHPNQNRASGGVSFMLDEFKAKLAKQLEIEVHRLELQLKINW